LGSRRKWEQEHKTTIMATSTSDLIRRSKLGSTKPPTGRGTVSRRQQGEDTSENLKLLYSAYQAWSSLAYARACRRRVRDYDAGRQWDDYVTVDGKRLREKDYIRLQGHVPLTSNIMASLRQNILGQYRSSPTKTMVVLLQPAQGDEDEVIGNAISAIHNLNYTDDLDAQLVHEKILSGATIQKVSYSYFRSRDRKDVKIKNLSFNRIFFNTDLEDIRVEEDIRLIGELHDYTLDDILCSQHYCRTQKDVERIRSLYASVSPELINELNTGAGLTTLRQDSLDFYLPTDTSKCRVIELWYLVRKHMLDCHDWLTAEEYVVPVSEKGAIVEENRRRLQQIREYNALQADQSQRIPEGSVKLVSFYERNEQVWHTKHLTPTGQTLWEAEDPFDDQDHPYVVGLSDFIDGELYGIGWSWIDQQRGINRNAMLLEMLIATSAKNLLLIHKDVIPKDLKYEDIGGYIAKMGNILVMDNDNPNVPAPQFLSNNATNIGIKEALQLYLDGIKNVSGVYGAIQGQQPQSGTPASRYAMESQNASLNMLNFFKQLSSFKERRDRKVLKRIKQFYTSPMNIPVIGTRDSSTVAWDPEVLADVDADIKVVQGAETPSYRAMVDQQMVDLVMKGLIPVEVYLESSSEGWTKSVLKGLQKLKEEAAAAQQASGQLSPEAMQQAVAQMAQGIDGADPESLAAAQEMLKQ